MAQTKPKAGQFYGVSDNGTDGQFLKTDGTGGMSWDSPITNPTITSIDYPGTQTAADPAGGESVIINGTLFASGITCTVGGTSAVTAFNSATQITITTPAKAAGQYTVAVTNTDGGTASQANFIQYSGVPVWSTAAGSLGNVLEGTAASFQVTATEGSDTIEYAVTTGTLPTGLSLATATGAITGTAPTVSADTTTTFSITATDDENQTSSSRSFSITVQNDAPSNHFNTVLWTGDGNAGRAIPVGFQPDMSWYKSRNNAYDHNLSDSVRGAQKQIRPNRDIAEVNATSQITAFTSTGLTLGNGGDANGGSNQTYVAWNFKAGGAAVTNSVGTMDSQVSANNTLGFSIASYTSTGTNGATFGHGLNAAPELVLLKCTSTGSTNWIVGGTTVGNNYYLSLNSTSSKTSSSNWLVSSATTLQLNQTFGNANTSGREYITYNFTSKPGFSKIGSYTGNGSASGPMVQTGFEPAFIMLKPTSIADNWMIYDNKRGDNKVLFPNLSNAESTYDGRLSFLANGFQITTTNSGWNGSGQTYIYLAIAADGSTATPSLANSFSTITYSGNGGTQSTNSLSSQAGTIGFAPDLAWIKTRSNVDSHFLWDTLRGANEMIIANSTGPQYNRTGVTAFNSNGFTLGNYGGTNSSGYTYVAWNWKAGGLASINTDGTITSLTTTNQAAGFSIINWSGNGSNDTIGHGLSSAPEMIMYKSISATQNWTVLTTAIDGSADGLVLNANTAKFDITASGALPTATVFGNVGFSSNMIAYCFTSITGYSKVGSYAGSNSNLQVNTGFQPTFLMLKNVNAATPWVMLSSSYTGYLEANSSGVESDVAANYVNFNSTGFLLVGGTGSYMNTAGQTWIYLAIKEN